MKFLFFYYLHWFGLKSKGESVFTNDCPRNILKKVIDISFFVNEVSFQASIITDMREVAYLSRAWLNFSKVKRVETGI